MTVRAKDRAEFARWARWRQQGASPVVLTQKEDPFCQGARCSDRAPFFLTGAAA